MKEEKIKRLNCRVSEEEYNSFEKMVEKSKLTKSEFMRKSILEKDIIGVSSYLCGFTTLRNVSIG
ncbi:hypothetical protein KPL40_18045 [Clostridium gasigenes]|uniref:plasmid mobilization protein n=1 Tax=Clostridium gasigenes TaxID=94869 RepID=UPI001C0B7B2B|nr:hypothetical protein [Clostridium gasigenes]MBU3134324.1 hypothetical protein [Clostridium gasigenes]